MYVLDTDTLIYFLKGHQNVVERVTDTLSENITTTIINQAELLFGVFNSLKKKQNLDKVEKFLDNIDIEPFCQGSAYIFAEKKALLKKQGNIVADLDLMIASIAMYHQRTLVTNNTKHFARINGLMIENWSAD